MTRTSRGLSGINFGGSKKKNQNYLTTTRNLQKEVGMATWRPFLSPRNFKGHKPYFEIKILRTEKKVLVHLPVQFVSLANSLIVNLF